MHKSILLLSRGASTRLTVEYADSAHLAGFMLWSCAAERLIDPLQARNRGWQKDRKDIESTLEKEPLSHDEIRTLASQFVSNDSRLRVEIRQEFFRAWMRFYPPGVSYDRLESLPEEQQQQLRQSLRATAVPSDKVLQALTIIKEEGPIKGILVARKLNIVETTFRKHYVPALKRMGVMNDQTGDGYYVPVQEEE
jgi:hypothetical protein